MVFVGLNLVAMASTRVGETVPFHFIWISLTVVYGVRLWALPATLAALVSICVLTAVVLAVDVSRYGLDAAELTEVPLMAAVFLVMIFHVRHRQAALETASRAAETERRLRENEREFLRDVSHLLRTPITIARGYTELLQAAAPDDTAGPTPRWSSASW